MPNMEELLNPISVVKIRDRTKPLLMSDTDLEYAYGQFQLSEETSKHCVFAITGGQFNGSFRCKKGPYGLVDVPTIFQEQIDQTLEYSTSEWLDGLIIVTRRTREEREEKIFE